MKRLTIISIILFCLCGCAREIDWIPVTFKVRVQDTQGNDYYYLAFGEFYGGSDYDNEELYLSWPDGSHNCITYKRKLHRVRIKADEVFKLDGVKCSNPVVIVK